MSATGRTAAAGVLAVLGAFDADHSRLTLTQLSTRAGLPLSTTHRLVAELVGWHALTRADDGCYQVGRRLWQLGMLAPLQVELRQAATPFMQDVYATTNENVHLAVRDGLEALYVELISGRHSVPIVSGVGRRLPLHATGVGKVLLAFAPPPIADEALRRPARITRHTIIDGGLLRRQLAVVHERGYARTSEEMSLGTCSVAVPVLGTNGNAVAALGIVVTSVRRDLMRLVPVLQVAAAGISRRLS